jgi:hypothetical protein
MATDRIMKEWQSFAAAVMPPGVEPIQYNEMRRAFFGGAHAMLMVMGNIADQAETDAAGADVIEEVNRELWAFSRGIITGEY